MGITLSDDIHGLEDIHDEPFPPLQEQIKAVKEKRSTEIRWEGRITDEQLEEILELKELTVLDLSFRGWN